MKSNLESNTKNTQFASKYPAGEERKKATDELQKQRHQSSSMLSNWTQSTSNDNLASFAVSLEIAKKANHSQMHCDLRYLSTTEKLSRRRIRAHYEQLSEFERGRIIGLKEAGWTHKFENRSPYRSNLSNTSLASQIARSLSNRACLGYDGKVTENVDDQTRQLEQIWQEITQEYIRVPYHSMLLRVAACIWARGGPTPY
ncbi:general transcription factor II-I repeat domain-containing protein 2 [Trichonephila clavipes]|nr:general transcription factor II-I repeat domain-containing protein 2 [Trichonephila clavipes]